jgi:selenocysteine-specific elongation factor
VLEELRREESGSPEDRLVAALDGMVSGVASRGARTRSGLGPEEFEQALEAGRTEGRIVELDDLLMHSDTLAGLQERAEDLLREFQTANPFRWGTSRGELKSRLAKKLPPVVFERVLEELTRQGRVTVREDHLRLGGEGLDLSPELAERISQVSTRLEDGGVSPPTVKDLSTDLKFPAGEVLEYLTFEGEAVKVTPELYLGHKHFQKLTDWLESFFQEHESLEVSQLRSTWGMTRKYSVPVLEYLDREGWTLRQGDVRVPGKRLGG